jgi:phage pi2 protein 07
VTLEIKTFDELYKIFRDTLIGNSQYSSSAKEFDEKLKDYPEKFFHEYKLPDDPAKFILITDELWLRAFPAQQIKSIEDVSNKNLNIDYNLADELDSKKFDAQKQIQQYAKQIENNNPELKGLLQTPDALSALHFIRGAGYGYPPENIQHFISNYGKLKLGDFVADKYRKTFENLSGIKPGLMRLTARQYEKLIEFFSDQKNKPAKSARPAATEEDFIFAIVNNYGRGMNDF